MRDAGVHVLPQLAIAADLQRSRRNVTGIRAFLNLLLKYACLCEETTPLDSPLI
jgi:hypothetical protein